MDSTTLPAPSFTAIDGVTQGIAAACYLAVGVAAWLRARDDVRTRVFLALLDRQPHRLWHPGVLVAAGHDESHDAAGCGHGGRHGFACRRRAAAVPFHTGIPAPPPLDQSVRHADADRLLHRAPDDRGAPAVHAGEREGADGPYILAVIVFGFPLLVLLGFVIPIAAIVSLFRSHQEIQTQGLDRLKLPLELILISQIAGGTSRSSSHRWRPSSRPTADAVGAHSDDLRVRPADAARVCGSGLEVRRPCVDPG